MKDTTLKPLFDGGRKGYRYRVFLVGGEYPWCASINSHSYYFETAREALCYLSGKGFFTPFEVREKQLKLMREFDVQLSNGAKFHDLLR